MLSHTILADLIEAAFVPCLVNNRGGAPADDEALAFFGEAKLNNPAVRIVDGERADVGPRYQCGNVHGDLRGEADAVFHLLANALGAFHAAGSQEQQLLPSFARQMGPTGSARVVGLGMESEWLVFTVGSFWTGEGLLGALPAALSSEAGWCGGMFQKPEPRLEQAVRLEFDSSLAGAGEVTTAALALGLSVTDEPTAGSFRSAKPADQKHCLRLNLGKGDHAQSLHRVALTPTQAMRANAACYSGLVLAEDYPMLSPRQLGQQELAAQLLPAKRITAPKHNEDL